jgi:hypothetical protein
MFRGVCSFGVGGLFLRIGSDWVTLAIAVALRTVGALKDGEARDVCVCSDRAKGAEAATACEAKRSHFCGRRLFIWYE